MSSYKLKPQRNNVEKKKSYEDLILSERNFRLFGDTLGRGVIYHAEDGEIILMNLAAEKILGKKEELRDKLPLNPERENIGEDGSIFPDMEHPSSVA